MASVSVALCICRLVNVLCELIYLDATTCYEHILFTKQTNDGTFSRSFLRCCPWMDGNSNAHCGCAFRMVTNWMDGWMDGKQNVRLFLFFADNSELTQLARWSCLVCIGTALLIRSIGFYEWNFYVCFHFAHKVPPHRRTPSEPGGSVLSVSVIVKINGLLLLHFIEVDVISSTKQNR